MEYEMDNGNTLPVKKTPAPMALSGPSSVAIASTI